MKTLSSLVLSGSIAALAPVHAATLGYWRFEDGAFLDDSSGNGNNLTVNNTATQVALPLSGNGSSYPTTIPLTSASNGSAAEFDGGDRMALPYQAAFKSTTMTMEAFVTTTLDGGRTGGATQTIAGMWSGSGTNRVFLMALTGTNVLTYYLNGASYSSGLPALVQNQDYYVGVSLDLLDATTNAITYYQKNLTTGEVWTSSIAAPVTSLATGTASFSIGSTSTPSSPFTGLIDEVRFSNTKLAENELLVVIPEPSAALLGGLGLLACLRRKRML